jgi:hypothetical protein
LASVDKIPSGAEPMFQEYNAQVEFHPVMILDLKKGNLKAEIILPYSGSKSPGK